MSSFIKHTCAFVIDLESEKRVIIKTTMFARMIILQKL